MTETLRSFVAIGLMAAITAGTRLSGPWIGTAIEAQPGLARTLRHLGTCVIAALVGPALVQGDWAVRFGVLVACTAMLICQRMTLSMFAGAVAAALFRAA